MKKRFGIKLVALLLVAAALLGCLTTAFAASKKQSAAKTETLVVYAADYPVEEDGWYSTMEEVAVYLTLYEKLPGNFISKYDAENLGWDNCKGNLDKVAPGCSIGGNRFGNYEGLLPEAKGRKYTECDINYDGGYRNGERIVFSNDGLIFYTNDHYQTFTPVKVIVEETEKAGEGKKK